MPSQWFPRGDVPQDIYQAQIDAMYSDSRTVWMGVFGAGAAPLCVGLEAASGKTSFIALALAMAMVGFFRGALINVYKRTSTPARSVDALRGWETLYVAGAAVHVGLLGLFCITAVSIGDDSFARVTSFAGTAIFVSTMPGRNFASNSLVNVVLTVATVPLTLAAIWARGYFWLYCLVVIAPSFVTVRTISLRVGQLYLEALLRARDLKSLANRFDVALNNMPHGLAMTDRDGKAVVANRRLHELLKLGPGDDYAKGGIEDLLRRSADAGAIRGNDIAPIVGRLRERVEGVGDGSEEILLHTSEGRILDLALEPMSNGGAVVLFEDVTERKITQARINELARFDPLTGLPNRTEFHDCAEAMLRASVSTPSCALMFVDLDNFKQVNDTLGHAVGDRLLAAVAKRLLFVTAPSDIVARFGGDEFVILLSAVTDHAYIGRAAHAVIEELSNPYQIADHNIGIGASVGIAVAAPECADVDALLRDADLALYHAKAEGRNTWRFFEPRLAMEAKDRRTLEFDLRRAFDADEFELNFQPVFNLGQKRFSGCEALIRWNHPTRGRVPPGIFVPMAEEMGLVQRLDDWVLKAACGACATWPLDMKVAVNVSALHFRDRQIVEHVKTALFETKLAPYRLEIEVTETALLHNIQATRAVLQELRQLGVRISLDDFGTGYSNLSYLHTLPLNKIKIDRSFLFGLERDSRALKLLSGITRMSADLGLQVVMEGVETEDELKLVTDNTMVDEIQGYFFGRPMSGSAIFSLFEERRLSAA